MSGNKEMFSSIDESVKFEVRMGNNNKVSVMGKWCISICTKQGEIKQIQDVYYVPGLKHNLISVGQLVQKEYKVIFENVECIIFYRNGSDSQITAVKTTKTRMFPLTKKNEFSAAFKVDTIDQSRLWHLIYGHLSYSGLNLLYKK